MGIEFINPGFEFSILMLLLRALSNGDVGDVDGQAPVSYNEIVTCHVQIWYYILFF